LADKLGSERKKSQGAGIGGGIVVSVFAFYSDGPNSNLVDIAQENLNQNSFTCLCYSALSSLPPKVQITIAQRFMRQARMYKCCARAFELLTETVNTFWSGW